MTRNTITNLPEVLQSGKIRATISYEFSDAQNEYPIVKGPAIEVYSVESNGTTYTNGVDYDLIQDSDENVKSIDWGIGGLSPDDGDLFYIDQEYESILSRYVEAHDDEMNDISEDFAEIVSIRQIDNAEDDELDRLGALFGALGRRQQRSDSDYRAFLKSVVASFEGRGSRSGLKFAIAAAINGEPSDINIVEDIENLSYTIQIKTIQGGVLSGAINDLAELADPSGVELEDAVILTEGEELLLSGSSSTTTTEVGLGGNTLTLDGNSQLQ